MFRVVAHGKSTKKIKSALSTIQQSNWDEERKKNFIVPAYSLLKLFTTAVFPMNELAYAITAGELHLGVLSPEDRVGNLWSVAENCESFESQLILVADVLDDLYKSNLSNSPKYQRLKEFVQGAFAMLNFVSDATAVSAIPEEHLLHLQLQEFIPHPEQINLLFEP